jgi:hypothetical protein
MNPNFCRRLDVTQSVQGEWPCEVCRIGTVLAPARDMVYGVPCGIKKGLSIYLDKYIANYVIERLEVCSVPQISCERVLRTRSLKMMATAHKPRSIPSGMLCHKKLPS